MNYYKCATCHGLNSMGFCQYTACRFPEVESGVVNASAYVPKIVTNADRIRAMSDEELAVQIAEWNSGDCPPIEFCPKHRDEKTGYLECTPWKCWLDWLRQEASDGT